MCWGFDRSTYWPDSTMLKPRHDIVTTMKAKSLGDMTSLLYMRLLKIIPIPFCWACSCWIWTWEATSFSFLQIHSFFPLIAKKLNMAVTANAIQNILWALQREIVWTFTNHNVSLLVFQVYLLLFKINFALAACHDLIQRMSFIFSHHILNCHENHRDSRGSKQYKNGKEIIIETGNPVEEIKS